MHSFLSPHPSFRLPMHPFMQPGPLDVVRCVVLVSLACGYVCVCIFLNDGVHIQAPILSVGLVGWLVSKTKSKLPAHLRLSRIITITTSFALACPNGSLKFALKTKGKRPGKRLRNCFGEQEQDQNGQANVQTAPGHKTGTSSPPIRQATRYQFVRATAASKQASLRLHQFFPFS